MRGTSPCCVRMKSIIRCYNITFICNRLYELRHAAPTQDTGSQTMKTHVLTLFAGALVALSTPTTVLAAENTPSVSGEIAFEL